MRRRSKFHRVPSGLYLPDDGRNPTNGTDPNARPTSGLATWLSVEQVIGTPFPIERIIAEIQKYDWRFLICGFARWAAVIANSQDGILGESVRKAIRAATEPWLNSPDALKRELAHSVVNPGLQRAVFHEHGIYFLQALAVVHGQENRQAPPDEWWYVAMAAASNDHLPDWGERVDEGTTIATLAAEMWRASRFNASTDPLRELVRGALLLDQAPSHGPLKDSWPEVQRAAFGALFRTYFADFAGVLGMMSHRWGQPRKAATELIFPIINLSNWAGSSESIRRWFSERTWTRSALAEKLKPQLAANRLTSHSHFYLRPFIQYDADVLCAFSPWTVRESLRLGPWAAMSSASRRVLEKKHRDAWFPAFGNIVEQWCRRVAREAENQARSSGFMDPRFVISDDIGTAEEVEDIVITDGRRIILFSIKGKVAEEKVGKGHASNSAILQWLKALLFAPAQYAERRSERYRAGALHLLDAKVRRLVKGEYAQFVGRPELVIPVVVTYEKLQDNLALYRWIDVECSRLGILKQPGVALPVLCDVAMFEVLMGLLAKGRDLFQFLGRWRSSEQHERIDVLLQREGVTIEESRIEFLERAFGAVTEEVMDCFRTRMIGDGQDPDAGPQAEK